MASDITITSLDVVGGVGSFVASAAWTAPNGLGCLSYMQPSAFRFYYGTSSNFANAALAGEAAIGLYNKGGLAKGTTYYVWARAVDSSGNEGDVYPSGAGVQVTTLTTDPGPNSVGSTELQNNAVDNNHLRSNAVTASKINVSSLSAISADLGSIKVDSAHIDSLAVDTLHLSNRAVTSIKIGLGEIETGNVDNNAITQIAASNPTGSVSVEGTHATQSINVPSGQNVGVMVDFYGFMNRPTLGAGNVGNWYLAIERNGSHIESSPSMFYDDNFAYPTIVLFSDNNPPSGNVTYRIKSRILSGPGIFRITGGMLRLQLFKR